MITEPNLVAHARRELELCGQHAEDPQYSESIIRAVAGFASYGHSGGSASVAIEQLHRLLNFEELSPLTSDPADWIDRSEQSGKPFWQNRRNSKAFSEDGGKTWWRLGGDEQEDTEDDRLHQLADALSETRVDADGCPAMGWDGLLEKASSLQRWFTEDSARRNA